MKLHRSVISAFTLALFSVLASPLVAKEKDTKPSVGASALARIYTAAETAEFKKLAQETLDALTAEKHTEMVAKLTDLETAWDDHEGDLKPRNIATWTSLDKTLDKAISSLRSSHTNPVKGKAALNELLTKLDQTTKS